MTPQRTITFRPEQTALLVIDPVNDFLSEGGAGWDLTKTTVEKNDVVNHLRRAIEGAREHAVGVIFAPMAYTEEDYADLGRQRHSAIHRLMFERRMFLAGTWGADFHPDLRPQADEIIVQPHKGLDVFQTDLPEHLERLGTTHLVIAGMTANLCCESTGRTAMERGYDVTYLWDAIGAAGLPAYESSIRVNYPLVANAEMDVDEFLAAIQPVLLGEPAEVGDTVYGSDHGEIGKVEKVVTADDETGYMIVTHGVLLEKDTYVPLDAIARRSGRRLFINIPKLVIGSMPWDEPPSAQAQAAKLGPRRDAVEHLYGSRSPSVDAPVSK